MARATTAAYHEAAHAVCAAAEGLRLGTVSIEPGESFSGICHTGVMRHQYMAGRGLVTSLAGYVFEDIYHLSDMWDDCSDLWFVECPKPEDLTQVEAQAEAACGGDIGAAEDMILAAEKAVRAFLSRPSVRKAVTKTARELMRSGRLAWGDESLAMSVRVTGDDLQILSKGGE